MTNFHSVTLPPPRLRVRLLPRDRVVLERIARLSGAESISEAVRDALHFTGVLVDLSRQGRQVSMQKLGTAQEYTLPVPRAATAEDGRRSRSTAPASRETLEVRLKKNDRKCLQVIIAGGLGRNKSQCVRIAVNLYSHVVEAEAKGWEAKCIDGDSGELLFPVRTKGPWPSAVACEGASQDRVKPLPNEEADPIRSSPVVSTGSSPPTEWDLSVEESARWWSNPSIANGVWLIATPTSCSWLMLHAMLSGEFEDAGIPVRGLVLRDSWKSSDLDRLLVDSRISARDTVLAQSLFTDVLKRLAETRVATTKGGRLQRLRILAPSACQPVTVTVRSQYDQAIQNLVGKHLGITHLESNFVMRLFRFMQKREIAYRLATDQVRPNCVVLDCVAHEDLGAELQHGRLDGFATVEPYHSKLHAELEGVVDLKTFTLDRQVDFPEYCCVVAVRESDMRNHYTEVELLSEVVAGARRHFESERTQAVREVCDFLAKVDDRFDRIADLAETDTGLTPFHHPDRHVVTPSEVAQEIQNARWFFEGPFLKLDLCEDYKKLVFEVAASESSADAGSQLDDRKFA